MGRAGARPPRAWVLVAVRRIIPLRDAIRRTAEPVDDGALPPLQAEAQVAEVVVVDLVDVGVVGLGVVAGSGDAVDEVGEGLGLLAAGRVDADPHVATECNVSAHVAEGIAGELVLKVLIHRKRSFQRWISGEGLRCASGLPLILTPLV